MTRLEEIATAALKRRAGDVEKALPEFVSAVRTAKLIDDLARVYLRQVVVREDGHGRPEAQIQGAGLTPSFSTAAPLGTVAREVGQKAVKAQLGGAGLAQPITNPGEDQERGGRPDYL